MALFLTRAGRAVDRIQMHRRQHRRQLRAVLDVQRDGLVAELADEVGLPVPLQTRRVERIEHALQRRMRESADQIERRRLEARGSA